MSHDWALVDVYDHYVCRRCDHVYIGKSAPRNDILISVGDERRPDGSLLLRGCDEMVILKVQDS